MLSRSNALLANLPESERLRLFPHLEALILHKGQTLFAMGQRPTHAYYPVNALVSMFIDLPDGNSVEAVTFGCTHIVGIMAMNEQSFYRATVRNSGLAYRIPISILKNEENNCPIHMHCITTAMHHLLVQMAQTIACSKLHTTEQQLIRWILTTMDHNLTSIIKITQQELSEQLGFRREAISLTMIKLKNRGEVKIKRGSFEVLNRAALEDASCDCYRVTSHQAIEIKSISSVL